MKKTEQIDFEIGKKIRSRRKQLSLPGKKVAAELGISPQQLSKYEKGKNRVSASMMVKINKILSTNMEYFFKDYSLYAQENEVQVDVNQQIKELTDSFKAIKNNKKRELVIQIAKSFSDS